MSNPNIDIDAALGVDDDMQKDIDTLKADPWELMPDKNGFTPSELVEDAPEDSAAFKAGKRERHYQAEICEIEDAGLRENKQDGKVKGLVAFIQFKCRQGKNKDKRIERSWWLDTGDKDAVRNMNADLQEMFGKLGIEPQTVKNAQGAAVRSYTASFPKLAKKIVKITLVQKWDHPWKMLGPGNFEQQVEEPKKFSKKIVRVERA